MSTIKDGIQPGAAVPEDKAFTTLVAQLALHGHQLHRSHPNDGPSAYFVSKWGQTRALRDLEAVEQFLGLIAGNNNTPTTKK